MEELQEPYDDECTYLLSTTGQNVTALATSDDDDITLAYGSVAASVARIVKLIANAQLDGTTRFTGSLTSIDADQAEDIGDSSHINDQDSSGSSNNISTMTLTTDVAISATVAANLAGKGTAVFSAGLTGTLSTYDYSASLLHFLPHQLKMMM